MKIVKLLLLVCLLVVAFKLFEFDKLMQRNGAGASAVHSAQADSQKKQKSLHEFSEEEQAAMRAEFVAGAKLISIAQCRACL